MAQSCIGLIVLLLLLTLATCDVYMHAPRGSNDRNCEKNVNRNNGNRLFDSQNNAKVPLPLLPHTKQSDHFGNSQLSIQCATFDLSDVSL